MQKNNHSTREHVIETWWRRQPGRLVCLSAKPTAGGAPRDFFYERDEIDVAAFIAEHRDENCYFVPHPFDRARRIRANAVSPRGLFADLDEVDPRKLGKLEPTIAIQSSRGRFVGLWQTDQVVSEELNCRLTYHLGADKSGWDFTQLLRLPGSLNHKYSPPHHALTLWDDGPIYRVSNLARLLPMLPERSSGSEHGAVTLRPSSLTPEEIVEREGIGGNLKHELLHGQPRGEDRSAMLWKMANRLHQNGVSRSRAYSLLWASPWNKHRDQGESGRIAMERMI